jgi:hypothetical protein
VRRGSDLTEVAVVGSDGGGTLFAVPLVAGAPVLRLPPSSIENGIYEPSADSDLDDLAVASDFDEFLTTFVDGLEQMVRDGGAGPFNDG